MSQGLAVFILMNNYFHDVATAMLFASAIAMRLMLNKAEDSADDVVRRLAKNMVRVVWFSVAWIAIGAVPRILTFDTFEWSNAVESHHESGLIAKYTLAGAMILFGAYQWSGLLRDMRKRKLI